MSYDFFQHPYGLNKHDKSTWFLSQLYQLSKHHDENCIPYHHITETLYPKSTSYQDIASVPFLPVQLFKQMMLKSITDDNISKVLTSSGTSSQTVSKIYLDKETAIQQSHALVSIVSHFLGKERLPMLIIDSNNVIKDRASFSARGAGILGFSSFGKDHTYLLNESMNIDIEKLQQFLNKHQGKKILLFGFTFMIWQYFYSVCQKQGLFFDLSEAILIHGGGWKKLAELNISHNEFKERMYSQFQITKIHDYYGMVEQVGSIFMACKHGHLHTPIFADIIIRDAITLEPLEKNHQGLIQVLSILPKSYPGHSLLTEDVGTLLGEDDCPCGLKGKYFKVHGRLPKAELRGCSDTHTPSTMAA